MNRDTVIATQHLINGRPLVIREAAVEDAAAMLAYAQDYFSEPDVYSPIAPGEFKLGIEEERKFITGHHKDNSILLLACLGDELIGCLNVTGGKTSRSRHVGTLGVSVARPQRGSGIGTILMQSAIDWVRGHPFMQRLELEVFSGNVDAIRLYQRLGFAEEGRRRRAYIWNDEPLDAVVMAMLFEK